MITEIEFYRLLSGWLIKKIKHMKNLFIILGMLLVTGCSKEFLDKHSLTQIADENFWKNEQDAFLGINGIYDVLQDRALYSGNLNGTAGFSLFDGIGDNAYNSFKFEGPGNFMEANITTSHAMFAGIWTSSYKGIFRANVALEKIPKITASNITEAKRSMLIGQALFLRALFYSNLAIYFREVPLILKTATIEEKNVKKNTYPEVSAQIVKDLTDAIVLLPATYPAAQYGYATKGAAMGLLARMHLYNKDYQGVIDATTPLLTMGYGLHNNYAQLFTEQGEFSNEIVFAVRFFQDAASGNSELFSGTFLAAPKVDQQPMKNLVNDYYCTDGKPITTSPLYNPGTPTNNAPQKNNRDPRLLASVLFRNDIFLVDLNRAFTGNTATGYGQKKYIRNSASPTGVAAFNPGGQDYYVIRYADVLLMRAEAFVELNQLTPVYPLVNQIRARVSMPSIETAEGTGLTQDQLRTIVMHERRVEMAFEGMRYFDLKRWGQLQQAYQRATVDNVAGYRPVFQTGKAGVFPIPENELNANYAIWQNPFW